MRLVAAAARASPLDEPTAAALQQQQHMLGLHALPRSYVLCCSGVLQSQQVRQVHWAWAVDVYRLCGELDAE
jgi:hypothetical protein